MKASIQIFLSVACGGLIIALNDLVLHSLVVRYLTDANNDDQPLTQSQQRPLWPQTDFRVREAILAKIDERIDDPSIKEPFNKTHYRFQGEVYEKPPTNTTLVSAFYSVPSAKHDTEKYETWATQLFSCTDPLVFFCEPGSKWPDFVRRHRQHAPTYLVELPFEDLPTVTNFDPSFWHEHATAHDSYNTPYVKSQDIAVYQIWNAKIILLHETAQMNPFQSDRLMWIDSGYYRESKYAVVKEPVVRNAFVGVQSDQILLHNVQPRRMGYLIAGGIWGGTPAAILHFYTLYWKTFWFMAQNGIYNLGYEQHVMVHLCKSFPATCNIHHAGGNNAWRIMGNNWIRNPQYRFGPRSSTRLHHLDANHTRAIGNLRIKPYIQPVVPSSGLVPLPQVFPIVSLRNNNMVGQNTAEE